jgi:hypothetical protein
VAVAPGTANWTTVNNGTLSNANSISFGPASGSGWGTVTAVAVTDNSTVGSGNLFYFGTLVSSKVIGGSDSLSFAANNLTLGLA